MKKNLKKEKVAVAMSGGVDSSVSAHLLKKEGFEVAGFYLKLIQGAHGDSLKKAKNVAKKLQISLHVVDARKDFKNKIISNFINEYKNLRTPNPCVICNKFIKFGLFLEKARSLGFSKIATGHYAKVKKDKDKIFHLYSGHDKNKDQSYFLHRLNQAQLSSVIFPLGEMQKEDVYKIAQKLKIPFDRDKESQEICFIKDGDYRNFLKKCLPKKHFKRGEILDVDKKVIGVHGGLVNYTIGQRKGIDQGMRKSENKKPLYVIEHNVKRNALLVGEEKDIHHKSVSLSNMNWISVDAKEKARRGERLIAKIRYRHAAAPCKLGWQGQKLSINFREPQRAITPGQYAVIYKGFEVLGGGIISK